MLDQRDEHQPSIRSNTCFDVADRRAQDMAMRRAAVSAQHASHDLRGCPREQGYIRQVQPLPTTMTASSNQVDRNAFSFPVSMVAQTKLVGKALMLLVSWTTKVRRLLFPARLQRRNPRPELSPRGLLLDRQTHQCWFVADASQVGVGLPLAQRLDQ